MMWFKRLFNSSKIENQSEGMKYLIAGLGNMGEEYMHTRHNIGFDILDAFAARHGAVFNTARLAETAVCKLRGRTLLLIKPATYMNLSGKAVKYWIDKEKIPVNNLLVIVDDLALPLDTLRLRPGGADAGHNGLKSIQEMLGTDQYPRLRFGIGNHYPRGRQVDFVLSRWEKDEEPVVRLKIEKSIELIESFIFMGITPAMNQFNHQKFNIL
jgi:PTH1 family peptidyl-tRNA hydrolase